MLRLWKSYYAQLWDRNGSFIKKIKFNRNSHTFDFDNRTYNIKLKEGSYFDDNTFLFDRRIYIYQYDCPDPIKMDEKLKPLINSDDYYTLINSKQLKELNNLTKSKLKLNFKHVIITLGIIVVGYLAFTGQLF